MPCFAVQLPWMKKAGSICSAWVSSVGLQARFNASGSADNILDEVSVFRGVLVAEEPANMQERASARRLRGGGLLYRYLHALLCCYLVSHCFTHFLGPPDHKRKLISASLVADIGSTPALRKYVWPLSRFLLKTLAITNAIGG